VGQAKEDEMKLFVAILGSLLLLAFAAFCGFGFLATFDPTENTTGPHQFELHS